METPQGIATKVIVEIVMVIIMFLAIAAGIWYVRDLQQTVAAQKEWMGQADQRFDATDKITSAYTATMAERQSLHVQIDDKRAVQSQKLGKVLNENEAARAWANELVPDVVLRSDDEEGPTSTTIDGPSDLSSGD